MLAFEFRQHAIDRASHTEWLVAADAAKRLFLLEDYRGRPGRAEVYLGLERNHLLRACGLA